MGKLNLFELTGQESGVVVYENGNTIICNWSNFDGLPHLLVPIGLFGFECDDITVEDIGKTENAIEYLEKVIYDKNEDVYSLENHPAIVWKLSNGTIILAPEGWH
jgi:hypothetical protein